MKILVCVRRLDRGGAELLECRLARELQCMGVEAHIAAQYNLELFDGRNRKKHWMAQGIRKLYFLNGAGWVGAPVAILRLLYIQATERYDAIISTNAGLDIYVGIAKFLLSFKHVIAFHTYVSEEVLQHRRTTLWRKIIKNADAYYSISKYVSDDMHRKVGIDLVRNRTIYNSIEIQREGSPLPCLRTELGLKKASKIILLVGRIEARKGFDIAIESLAGILRQEDTFVVIVGEAYHGKALESGLLDFHHHLGQRIDQLKLARKVLFAGYRKNIRDIMIQGSVFVHLARHEGFGLVLLEAIAAGLPVVASNVGGMPEVLRGTPYRSFALYDKCGIAREVERWLDMDKHEKRLMLDEARKVLTFYTDQRRAIEVEKLLKNVIANDNICAESAG